MNELIRVKLVNYDQENDHIVTTSKKVAEVFEKRHDHVLRDIEELRKDLPNFGEMFYESEYLDNYGRKQKQYQMNRDGFSLLSMGFTGSKALIWKLKFIEAFNFLEKEYNSPEKVMARALKIADDTINNLRLENKVQQQQIQEFKPKATYYDLVLQNKDLISMSAIAKDYGKSATAFNKLLNELGVQYKQGKIWLLYQEYADKGYTSTKTHVYSKAGGDVGTAVHTYWTQQGRLFIYHLLKKEGILPLIEQMN